MLGHPFIYTVGCVAGDEEAYEVFSDLYDPVIEKRHNGYSKDGMFKELHNCKVITMLTYNLTRAADSNNF